MLGTVSEMEGDTGAAIELFEKTFELALDSNTELAVVARVRMGTLLQQPKAIMFRRSGNTRYSYPTCRESNKRCEIEYILLKLLITIGSISAMQYRTEASASASTILDRLYAECYLG